MEETPLPVFDAADMALAKKFRATLTDSSSYFDTLFADITDPAQRERLKKDRSSDIHNVVFPLSAERQGFVSSDVGDVSWTCPIAQSNIATLPAGIALHSLQAVALGKSPLAKKGMLYAGKVLAATGIVLLVLTGCIDSKTALATFGSTTVITMASMFIVAAGLSRTQMINHISRLLYKVTDGSYTKILASYVIITCIPGQFVPSIVALFALVCPLVENMYERMKISPSKMMYPVAIASVSTSFIIEPIEPYAAWYVTQNGYMESYGWTATKLAMWHESAVFLPVGLLTILLAVFVVPRFLPDEPVIPITSIVAKSFKDEKPLDPVREFLGYAIFIVVILCLMLGLPSWEVTMIGAIIVVMSGILTEREAINNLNMSTILLYVGVSVLGSALSNTGAADMLGNAVADALSGFHNGYIIGAAFYVISFFMTSVLYNRAVTTVLVPLAVITCSAMGCDPRGPIILCSLASMSSLVTPMATAVVPMAMNAGGYDWKTIVKAGAIPGIVRGVVGTLIAMTMFPI